MPLVNSTSYRMLVSPNGTQIKQGDIVLIWGAVGGLGGFALQYVLNAGAFPICVVSSQERVRLCETIGARWVIDRRAEGFQFWNADGSQNTRELRRLGQKIRDLTNGEDPDVVYEHPGHDTFAASVYIARPGGSVVTCASTTGYMHEYDNRYLWMNRSASSVHTSRIIVKPGKRIAWSGNAPFIHCSQKPILSLKLAKPPIAFITTCRSVKLVCCVWLRKADLAFAIRPAALGTSVRSTCIAMPSKGSSSW